MYTLQDLAAIGDNEEHRMNFVLSLIMAHKNSERYKTAKIAQDYASHRNTTITNYQKMLYTISGRAVPDRWGANYKIASNFFNRFITQQVQFLLGNGVTWENESTMEALGEDFDTRLQEAGKKALICAVSFGFYNLDHVEVFSLLEFAPLYDEENGALGSGVRFWQIDAQKPLRATLYEMDGYTDYIWEEGEGRTLREKRPYIINVSRTEADGLTIYEGENYPAFPIVPLWANEYKQSEIVGIREQIDAYDFIKSSFCNDLDEAQIFWTINNAGGMDDIDLADFVQRMKTVKAVALGDGQSAEAHTIEMPYAARKELLDNISSDLYRDFMALDTDTIASGAVNTAQINAAYEPLNSKTDEFEFQVIEFIKGILNLAGIEDNPTFTRSYIINQTEEIQKLVASGSHLPSSYITEKILKVLGDGDKAEEILAEMDEEEIKRGFDLTAPKGDEMNEQT